mmetsp:Transcript_12827/g.27025  ORF Transcript_12827/g.27025 Transcript_12827/m.27025 type:complete len:113 (+) Transcript_12827:231-569(+)
MDAVRNPAIFIDYQSLWEGQGSSLGVVERRTGNISGQYFQVGADSKRIGCLYGTLQPVSSNSNGASSSLSSSEFASSARNQQLSTARRTATTTTRASTRRTTAGGLASSPDP